MRLGGAKWLERPAWGLLPAEDHAVHPAMAGGCEAWHYSA